MSDALIAIDFVLENEGGYVVDDGGPTNFGITAKYLMDNKRWQYDFNGDGTISANDMRKFTREDAIAEYKIMFNDEHYDRIFDTNLSSRLFDMCVNAGAKQANILLQRSVNIYSSVLSKDVLEIDGIMGNMTISHTNDCDPVEILNNFKSERKKFYIDLAASDPEKYDQYLNGWLGRADK